MFWFSLDIFDTEVGLLGQKADLFWAISILFSTWLLQSVFPPTVQKCSLFSTTSPALIVCWFVYDDCSDWCEVVSPCGFNLHLSDGYWWWASFHMSLCPLYVFLGEVSVQVLCPFFNWTVCLPEVEVWVLYVFWRLSLYLMYHWQICFPIWLVPFSHLWCSLESCRIFLFLCSPICLFFPLYPLP